MDAEEQRYEELKARWQALHQGDREPEPGYDEDGWFAEFVDDVGGGDLDHLEEYIRECEEAAADPVVQETHDAAGRLKALGPEDAAGLSPEGLRHWFERRVLWASLCGTLPHDIPADPSAMGWDEMLAAVREHPDIFAPKVEGSGGVH